MTNFVKLEGQFSSEGYQIYLDLRSQQTATIEQKQGLITIDNQEITKLQEEIAEMEGL